MGFGICPNLVWKFSKGGPGFFQTDAGDFPIDLWDISRVTRELFSGAFWQFAEASRAWRQATGGRAAVSLRDGQQQEVRKRSPLGATGRLRTRVSPAAPGTVGNARRTVHPPRRPLETL